MKNITMKQILADKEFKYVYCGDFVKTKHSFLKRWIGEINYKPLPDYEPDPKQYNNVKYWKKRDYPFNITQIDIQLEILKELRKLNRGNKK